MAVEAHVTSLRVSSNGTSLICGWAVRLRSVKAAVGASILGAEGHWVLAFGSWPRTYQRHGAPVVVIVDWTDNLTLWALNWARLWTQEAISANRHWKRSKKEVSSGIL